MHLQQLALQAAINELVRVTKNSTDTTQARRFNHKGTGTEPNQHGTVMTKTMETTPATNRADGTADQIMESPPPPLSSKKN